MTEQLHLAFVGVDTNKGTYGMNQASEVSTTLLLTHHLYFFIPRLEVDWPSLN